MNKNIINPWQWQEKFGFVQACEITNAKRILYCSGQTSVDAAGNPLYPGDLTAQLNQCLNNLETILKHAGTDLSHVVQLKYYTTDIAGFPAAAGVVAERMIKADCMPTSTLLGVTALFHPDITIELEAIAVY